MLPAPARGGDDATALLTCSLSSVWRYLSVGSSTTDSSCLFPIWRTTCCRNHTPIDPAPRRLTASPTSLTCKNKHSPHQASLASVTIQTYMPIKIPKPFPRRKSSGNALEELTNPPQPSFRVFERPDSKSFDNGSTLKRMSQGRPLSAGHNLENTVHVEGSNPNPSNRYAFNPSLSRYHC